MQPELKAALNPAYKRKIEGLVRRRERWLHPQALQLLACALHAHHRQAQAIVMTYNLSGRLLP